ncbi:MAG: DUF1737 domain-containing protein [Syntrophaceae bacterium]|nr:DUF1737 domain-containing protein [Syntrophaceae bacterium]
MEYKIISGKGWTPEIAVKELEHNVNLLIKEGWEPIGGVIVTSFNENVYQALIRRKSGS